MNQFFNRLNFLKGTALATGALVITDILSNCNCPGKEAALGII